MEETPAVDLPLSKTKKKQLAKEIEKLAVQLTEMSEKQYVRLTLPDSLAQEIALARSTRGRGSHKRQIKHLAGALRKQDEELQSLLAQLENLDQVSRGEKQEFHRLEILRDQLCDQGSFDAAFSEMLDLCPRIDRKTISRLARSVHQHEDKRAAREIFRRLRDEVQAIEADSNLD